MKTITKISFLICLIAMLTSLVACAYGGKNFGPSLNDSASGSHDGGFMDDISPAPGYGDGGFKGETAPELGGDFAAPDGEVSEGGDSDDDAVKNENVLLPSGMITASAWNDNDNYQQWLALFSQGQQTDTNGKFYEYTKPLYSWGFNSLNRIKVYVSNGEKPVAGATVVATDDQGNSLFSAITDAQGNAYLFTDAKSGNISVKSGAGSANGVFTETERSLSIDLAESANKLNVIELMLVVDVTGSMGDEIHFLKAELADVINRIAQNNANTVIKLAMLFYRDTDDSVPFDYYDFTDVTTEEGLSSQQKALNDQSARGGGDYPEAVDEALDIAVNKQWSTGATTKIIFQVLDAPAHNGSQYKEKFVSATKIAAEKGIRICPIICSGAATEAEYTMREAAVYTGGTFIFVTDDSGIGGSHHDPGLPNVNVELLNSLMVRLVNGYHTGVFADPIFWKEDPNLAANK